MISIRRKVDKNFWYHYWKRKGHTRKKLVDDNLFRLDSHLFFKHGKIIEDFFVSKNGNLKIKTFKKYIEIEEKHFDFTIHLRINFESTKCHFLILIVCGLMT